MQKQTAQIIGNSVMRRIFLYFCQYEAGNSPA